MKTNWIVINIYHERYMFSCEMNRFNDMTLDDVLCEIGESKDDLEISNDGYRIDHCGEYKDGMSKYRINAYYIIEETKFLEDDFTQFVFGKTKSKYGLFDKYDR